QSKRANVLQALDHFQETRGFGWAWWLTQPGQRCPPPVRRYDEQRIELLSLLLGESFGEGGEHLLLRPAASFPAKPFQGRDSRQDHMAGTQFLNQGFHQYHALIGAQRD